MPLAKVGDKVFPKKMTTAECAVPPVTQENCVFEARKGNAAWSGSSFEITDLGLMNCWKVPAVQNKVSYCVVHEKGAGDAYVLSDQFGGCQWHILRHADRKLWAFLHVYRGGGKLVEYSLADGWALQEVLHSATLSQKHGMSGSNWVMTRIFNNRTELESTFLHLTASYPPAVVDVHNGDE